MKKILLALGLSVFCLSTSAAVEVTSFKQISDVHWVKMPRIIIDDSDLQGQEKTVVVNIKADSQGSIISAEIDKSSGSDRTDNKIIMAIKRAKLKPYQINGVYYPVTFKMPISMVP